MLERQHVITALILLVLTLSFFEICVELLSFLLSLSLLVYGLLKSLLLIREIVLQLFSLGPQHLMVLECLHNRIMQFLKLLLIGFTILRRDLALPKVKRELCTSTNQWAYSKPHCSAGPWSRRAPLRSSV
jgi:hypothetical protein